MWKATTRIGRAWCGLRGTYRWLVRTGRLHREGCCRQVADSDGRVARATRTESRALTAAACTSRQRAAVLFGLSSRGRQLLQFVKNWAEDIGLVVGDPCVGEVFETFRPLDNRRNPLETHARVHVPGR